MRTTPQLLAARAATSCSELQAVESHIKRKSGVSWIEAPGLHLLRMSSLHALGSRTRGSSESAAADAAHLVPGLSAAAAASASAAASALRAAGSSATPVNRSAAQADPEAALRALAKSRSLRRLARDVGALKRRARGRERAEVHRGSQKGSSSALTERRSAEEHFGRSAAAQAAEEAAQLASLGPATLGPPKRARESAAQKQRRRLRRRLRLSGKLQESADSDEQLREDAALSAFVGREWNEGVSTPGLPAPLRVTAPRKSAARALFSEHLLASCAYTTGGPRLLFRLRRGKRRVGSAGSVPLTDPLDSHRPCWLKFASLVGSSSSASGVSHTSNCQTGVRSALSQADYCRAVLRFLRT